MALGGVCALFRTGRAPEESGLPPDAATVERMAWAVPWRSAGGVSGVESGPAVVAGTAAGGESGDRALARAGSLTVAADSRLICRRALAEVIGPELLPAGSESSDAELILAAYRRWRDDCVDHLQGSFAFVLWDGERRRLFCARDPIGSRSLHWARLDGAVVVASDALQIAATGTVSSQLDGLFFLDLLTCNSREQARSPYAAVRRVLPGHCLSAGADGCRGWRYWRPELAVATGTFGDPDDWVEAFRSLLETVVREHLEAAEGGAAMLTSGGLDSSTLAAIAQRAYRRGEMRSRPVALIDVFERLRECDESEYGRVLVEETGIAAEWIVADDLSDLRPGRKTNGSPADSPYSLAGELADHVLDRATERGCRLLTTGYGGDSLFDAARWQTYDHVRRGRLQRVGPWVAGSIAAGASWHRALAAYLVPPLLSYGGRRRLDRLRGCGSYWQAPPWLAQDLRPAAEERLGRQDYPRCYPSFAKQRQWEHIVGLAQQGIPIEFWTANAARRGVEATFPLLDRRLAELVLAAPIELGASPGPAGSKWLLRQAVTGVLPEQIRLRAGKASWSAHTRATLCTRLSEELRRSFGGRSHLAALGLVDEEALLKGLDRFCHRGAPALGAFLGMAWLAERWLNEVGASGGQLGFDASETWEGDEVV